METLKLDDTIDRDVDWRKLKFNLIKNYVSLFTDFILDYTNLFMAHGRTLSIYDTVKLEWCHINFKGFTKDIFLTSVNL